MGRFDISRLRYMTPEEFRVLHGIETGMRSHELVPEQLIVELAGLKHGGAHKLIGDLIRHKLVGYERHKKEGYRLTNLGYDFLALNVFAKRDVMTSVGNKIGVGKESDIYLASGPEGQEYALKLHRLGRTSFRNLKTKRDYHAHRKSPNWLYLSRLSATKEFNFMQVLYDHGFPVPVPVDCNRHCVLMSLVDGFPLCQVREILDPEKLYTELMDILVRFAQQGLIHGDFNEFNLMVNEDGKITVIDFPQMVSMSHPNAREYFERDVQCIVTFFGKQCGFESPYVPQFDDIKREGDLDVQLAASGFSADEHKQLLQALESTALDDDDDDDGDDDSEGHEDGQHTNEEAFDEATAKDEGDDDDSQVSDEGEDVQIPEMKTRMVTKQEVTERVRRDVARQLRRGGGRGGRGRGGKYNSNRNKAKTKKDRKKFNATQVDW